MSRPRNESSIGSVGGNVIVNRAGSAGAGGSFRITAHVPQRSDEAGGDHRGDGFPRDSAASLLRTTRRRHARRRGKRVVDLEAQGDS